MTATDDPIATDIQGLLDSVQKQLDPSDGKNGAIASNQLQITTAAGIGAFGTAAAGAATAIIGAAKGHSDSIVIAALAFAAIALLAIVLVVRSDHKARASVYVALETALPALITSAKSPSAPAAADTTPATSTTSYVVPMHNQVRVRLSTTGDELFDVLAIRVDIDTANPWSSQSTPTPWYLTGQIGGSPPLWRQGEIGSLAGPPNSGSA